MADLNIKGKYLMFREKPLLRDKNMICYGDMNDKFVLVLLILTNKTVKYGDVATEIPDRIWVQLWSTDTKVASSARIEKQFEKTGLHDAMDLGLIWLDRLNRAA